MQAKSYRYQAQGGIEIVTFDVPNPGPGEVQVRGGACGICAWDLYTFKHGASAPYAAPPGHEGVGYVTAVGDGVVGLAEGDRVVGGGAATVRNLKAAQVYRLPDSELPDIHWLVEPVSCVVTGVDHCDLHIADRLAVVGCGFMGLMLVQCLAHSFAEQLIAIDIDPQRLELAKAYGAQHVLNPRLPEFDEQIAALKGDGLDTVVDASGAQAGLDLSTQLVRRGGRINLFGWVHGQAHFPGDLWHLGGYTVVCSSPAARLRDPFPVAIRLIHAGMVNLEQLVTHVVPLDDLASLLERVTRGETPDYIKGVISLD
jgi:L-iditol 2-dehydrogenase